MVTGSGDHTLRVWRLADCACLRTLTGHTADVCAVVDVGGGRVASGGYDSVLRVWEVLSGKQLQQTPVGDDVIWCAAALWNDRIATGHDEGEIRLWSLGGGGGAAGALQGHTNSVISLAVVGSSSAQRLLASGSWDHSVRLWDVDAGTCTAVLRGHTDVLRCLTNLGGGWLLSGSEDNSIRVWNTATGASLAVVPNADADEEEEWFISACALPGGAATGSDGGIVRQWKWDEGANALTADGAALQLEDGPVFSLAAVPGPDGVLLLLAGCKDSTLRVLGANGGPGRELQQQAGHAGHSEFIRGFTVMHHGTVAAASGRGFGAMD